MKDKIEILNYLTKYLAKKGIEIKNDGFDRIIYNYKRHYTECRVTMYFNYNINNNYNTIKYYCTYNIPGIRRRRTKTNGNCGLSVYKNLLFIISKLDIIAEEEKRNIDLKNKYCSELESYYKRKHKKVNISLSKTDTGLYISIISRDIKVQKFTYYTIHCINNKYYLTNKTTNFNNNKTILSLT